MASQRNFLIIAFFFVSFFIWQAWNRDHEVKPTIPVQTADSFSVTSSENTPSQTISVTTDVLKLDIKINGGDVTSAQLLAYPKSLHSKEPFPLLIDRKDFSYVAESGLAGKDGNDKVVNNQTFRTPYTVSQQEYILADGQDNLTVPLIFEKNGVSYTKNFVFKRGSYDVAVTYEIQNNGATSIEVQPYGALIQSINEPEDLSTGNQGGLGASSYRGTAYSSSETNYSKTSFDKIKDAYDDGKNALNITTNVGWIAMLQHYFATAWIPEQNSENQFLTRYHSNKKVDILFIGQKVVTEPNSTSTITSHLWVGPEIQDELATAAKHLDLVVDYGWLWFLSQPLFHLLKFIQSIVINWGFSIIVITFIIRGILFPLTRAQYKSMARMKLLQPRIQALKERYGEDRQKLSQETMAMYKQEKVNPLGGCLPLLIQMPIFLSLFYMLSNSIELRQAPFILWIQDLAAPDPYYILPLFMGLTMFLIQKMSPTPVTDPLQQKLMTFMPLIFTVFFLWFPSGLVLYYAVSNLFTLAQQRIIYWELEKKGLHESKSKKKK